MLRFAQHDIDELSEIATQSPWKRGEGGIFEQTELVKLVKSIE